MAARLRLGRLKLTGLDLARLAQDADTQQALGDRRARDQILQGLAIVIEEEVADENRARKRVRRRRREVLLPVALGLVLVDRDERLRKVLDRRQLIIGGTADAHVRHGLELGLQRRKRLADVRTEADVDETVSRGDLRNELPGLGQPLRGRRLNGRRLSRKWRQKRAARGETERQDPAHVRKAPPRCASLEGFALTWSKSTSG